MICVRSLLFFLIYFILQLQVSKAQNIPEASLWLQEKFSNKTCGDINDTDLLFIDQQTNSINKSCMKSSELLNSKQNFNDISEKIFFERMAKKLWDDTNCEISNIDYFAKDESLIKMRSEEIVNKLPIIKEHNKQEKRAYFDFSQLDKEAQNFAGYCRNTTGNVRDECYLELDKKKLKAQEAEDIWRKKHSLVVAHIGSLWHGTTKEMMNLIYKLISSRNSDNFEYVLQQIKTTIPKVKSELEKNKLELYKQSNLNRRNIKFDSLNDETKSMLIEQATGIDGFFQEALNKKDESTLKLLCRLEGRYTKGKQILNRTVGSVTMFVGGMAGLLVKIPLAVRVSQLGALINRTQSSAVLIGAATAGVDAAIASTAIINKCFMSSLSHSIKNACPKNELEFKKSEINLIEQNNCVLDVIKSIAPAGLLAASKLAVNLVPKLDAIKVNGIVKGAEKPIGHIPDSLTLKFNTELITQAKLAGIQPDILEILIKHSSGVLTVEELLKLKQQKGVLFGLANDTNSSLQKFVNEKQMKKVNLNDNTTRDKYGSAKPLAQLVNNQQPVVFLIPKQTNDTQKLELNKLLIDELNWLLEDPAKRMKKVKFVFGAESN